MSGLLKLFVAVCLLSSVKVSAQRYFDMDIGAYTGYEHNIFRASSSSNTRIENGTNEFIQSGFFQSFDYDSRFKIKKGHHRFYLDGELSFIIYPLVSEANQIRPKFKFMYSLRPGKSFSLYALASYKKYNALRVDDQGDEFLLQRAFEKFEYALRYQLRINKRFRLKVKPSLIKARFNTLSNRIQYYDAYGLKVKLSQLLYSTKKYVHTIHFEIDAAHRNYYTGLDSGINGIRNYLGLNLDYEIDLTDKAGISFSVDVMDRLDPSQNRLGYRQILPSMSLELLNDKVRIYTKLSFTHRRYKTLLAGKGSTEFLVQNYLKANLTIAYKLRKSYELFFKCSAIDRSRNQVDLATSFLPYDNYKIKIGITADMF